MYRKILVPLDGSRRAECVLPHLRAMTCPGLATSIVLFRAVEPVLNQPKDPRDRIAWPVLERLETQGRTIALEYLSRIAGTLGLLGVKVSTAVVVGKPGPAIAQYARENGTELIVMATHLTSGVRRLLWGSVTDTVLHSSSMPVLLVKDYAISEEGATGDRLGLDVVSCAQGGATCP